MSIFENPAFLLVRIPAILLALTVHELAHALAAKKLGDLTADQLGRITLNPIPHLDLFGTLMLLLGPFGWAKPVPVDPRNLNNPKKDMIWIALAGPGVNVVLALLCGLVFKGLIYFYPALIVAVYQNIDLSNLSHLGVVLLVFMIQINIGLACFNLIPIPPLDGSKILFGILSPMAAAKYDHYSKHALQVFLVLFLLSFIGFPIINYILYPYFHLFQSIFLGIPLGSKVVFIIRQFAEIIFIQLSS